MKKLNKDQNRLFIVLDRFYKYVKENPELLGEVTIDIFNDNLECFLNDLQNNDYFGTEGQLDPRGDFRKNDWSMTCVDLNKK